MFNHKQIAKTLKTASESSDARQKAAEASLRAAEAEKAAQEASRVAWDGLFADLRAIVASDPVASEFALGRILR